MAQVASGSVTRAGRRSPRGCTSARLARAVCSSAAPAASAFAVGSVDPEDPQAALGPLDRLGHGAAAHGGVGAYPVELACVARAWQALERVAKQCLRHAPVVAHQRALQGVAMEREGEGRSFSGGSAGRRAMAARRWASAWTYAELARAAGPPGGSAGRRAVAPPEPSISSCDQIEVIQAGQKQLVRRALLAVRGQQVPPQPRGAGGPVRKGRAGDRQACCKPSWAN